MGFNSGFKGLRIDRSTLPSICSLPTPACYPTNHSVYPIVGRDGYTIPLGDVGHKGLKENTTAGIK